MTMKETIDRNHIEMRKKYRQQREIARREEKKEKIIAFFIGISIIIGVFILMGTMNDNAKDICKEQTVVSMQKCLKDNL